MYNFKESRSGLNKEILVFCFKCGKKIVDGAKFCHYCGANLEAVSEKQSTPSQKVKIDPLKLNNRNKVNEDTKIKIKEVIDVFKQLNEEQVDDYANNVSWSWLEHYDSLLEYLNKDKDNDDIEKIIKWKDISEIKYALDASIIEESKDLTEQHIGGINVFVEVYKDFDLRGVEKFMPSKEMLSNLNKKYQVALKYNIQNLYNSCNSLQSLQYKLIAQYPYIKRISEDGEYDLADMADMAKNFGLGALAVANPLIGVPLLMGKFLGLQRRRMSLIKK